DLYTLTAFKNDSALWRLGYPTDTATYTVPQAPLSKKHIDYDADMNQTYVGSWDSTHALFLGPTSGFRPDGTVDWTKDPVGGLISFGYDAYAFVHTVTNQLKQVTTKDIDP